MKKIALLTTITLCLFFIECKKYEEGPTLSFKTPKQRLKDVIWKVKSYVVNGEEKIQEYRDSCDCYFSFSFFDQEAVDPEYIIDISCTNFYIMTGFIFSDDKNFITFKKGAYADKPNPNTPLVPTDEDSIWEILRLTNKELKLKTIYKNIRYEVEFYK